MLASYATERLGASRRGPPSGLVFGAVDYPQWEDIPTFLLTSKGSQHIPDVLIRVYPELNNGIEFLCEFNQGMASARTRAILVSCLVDVLRIPPLHVASFTDDTERFSSKRPHELLPVLFDAQRILRRSRHHWDTKPLPSASELLDLDEYLDIEVQAAKALAHYGKPSKATRDVTLKSRTEYIDAMDAFNKVVELGVPPAYIKDMKYETREVVFANQLFSYSPCVGRNQRFVCQLGFTPDPLWTVFLVSNSGSTLKTRPETREIWATSTIGPLHALVEAGFLARTTEDALLWADSLMQKHGIMGPQETYGSFTEVSFLLGINPYLRPFEDLKAWAEAASQQQSAP